VAVGAPGPAARSEGRALRVYSRVVEALVGAAMALAGAALLASFALIGWAVVKRYAFNAAPVWVDDVVGFLLVVVVMLSAAQTLRRGEHIGVDLLVARLSSTGRRWALAWAAFATALISAVLVVKGWDAALFAKTLGLVTEGALEWPSWLLMLFVPLGGVLLLLAALESFWRALAGAPPTGAPARVAEDDG